MDQVILLTINDLMEKQKSNLVPDGQTRSCLKMPEKVLEDSPNYSVGW